MFSRKDYVNWYNHALVKRGLVYQLMYREGALLGENLSVRNIKVRDESHLLENIKRFETLRNKLNWYYSLAILNKMPIFSFNWEERRIQSNIFRETFKDFMVGYDLALDFDSKQVDFDVAYKDMVKVHNWLDSGYCAHSVRFSGSGFHIIIPSRFIWQSPFIFKKDLSPSLCGIIASGLKQEMNLESCDLSVYDERRIWKVPYSYDIKTGNVCRPLNHFEIRKFDFEMVTPKYCFNNFSDVFFNRRMFKGTNRLIHKFIMKIFKTDNARNVWKAVREV